MTVHLGVVFVSGFVEFSAVSHFQKRKVVDVIVIVILFLAVNIYFLFVAKIGYVAKKSHRQNSYFVVIVVVIRIVHVVRNHFLKQRVETRMNRRYGY